MLHVLQKSSKLTITGSFYRFPEQMAINVKSVVMVLHHHGANGYIFLSICFLKCINHDKYPV